MASFQLKFPPKKLYVVDLAMIWHGPQDDPRSLHHFGVGVSTRNCCHTVLVPARLAVLLYLRRPAGQGQRYYDSAFLLGFRSASPVNEADDMLWHFERRLKQAVQRARKEKCWRR